MAAKTSCRAPWRSAANDLYRLPAGPTAANPPQAAAAADSCKGQIDRQTDGQTPDRYADPAPHTIRTMSLSVSMSTWSLRWHFTNKSVPRAPYSINSHSLSQLDTMVKSTMTETCSAVLRSRRNCSDNKFSWDAARHNSATDVSSFIR